VQTQSLIPLFEDSKLHSSDLVAKEVFKNFAGEIQVVKDLANPDTCDVKYLPFLAWAFKVDFWDESLSENDKRELIKASITLHQKKGTQYSIMEVLKATGLSKVGYEAEIVEYKDRNNYNYVVPRDGTYKFDGYVRHNDSLPMYEFVINYWYEFAVILRVSVDLLQIEKARKLIEIYKPVRSILVGFAYATIRRDGSIFYDSKNTHGLV
jgi:phage tail P2-like protein